MLVNVMKVRLFQRLENVWGGMQWSRLDQFFRQLSDLMHPIAHPGISSTSSLTNHTLCNLPGTLSRLHHLPPMYEQGVKKKINDPVPATRAPFINFVLHVLKRCPGHTSNSPIYALKTWIPHNLSGLGFLMNFASYDIF